MLYGTRLGASCWVYGVEATKRARRSGKTAVCKRNRKTSRPGSLKSRDLVSTPESNASDPCMDLLGRVLVLEQPSGEALLVDSPDTNMEKVGRLN